MKETKETITTSQDYIINFYALIQQLITTYSEYEEIILEIKGFNKENPEEKIDIDKQEQIKNYNRLIRKIINQIQIHYNTFEQNNEKDEINKQYKEITTEYLLEREKLRQYIIKINKYTLQKLMPNINQKNTDIYQN